MLRHSCEYILIVLAIIYIVIYVIAVRNKYIENQHNKNLLNPNNIYKYVISIYCFIVEKIKSFLIVFLILLGLNIVMAKSTGYLAGRRATPHPNIDSLTWLEVVNYIPDLIFICLILVMLAVIVGWLGEKEGWR